VTSWQAGPGRRMLASASQDETVRLWPLPDGAAGLAGLPAVPGGRVAAGNNPEPAALTAQNDSDSPMEDADDNPDLPMEDVNDDPDSPMEDADDNPDSSMS
ncbi:hypothetical protein, partial [Micromonospora olivasterospora]